MGTPERRPAPIGAHITLVVSYNTLYTLDIDSKKMSKTNIVRFQSPQVPAGLVDRLERLALVDFRSAEGLRCLQRAVRFADQLQAVDTQGVEPMDSVLEHRYEGLFQVHNNVHDTQQMHISLYDLQSKYLHYCNVSIEGILLTPLSKVTSPGLSSWFLLLCKVLYVGSSLCVVSVCVKCFSVEERRRRRAMIGPPTKSFPQSRSPV